MQHLIVIACLLLSPALPAAEWRPLASVKAERFDASSGAWKALPAQLGYRSEPEGVQLRLPLSLAGQALTARLDFKRLPHYGPWVAQQQARGGAEWIALKALLDEIGDGPAMGLIQEPLPRAGGVQLLLGLRRGTRFELHASVPAQVSVCGPNLCFDLKEPVFSSPSSAFAWMGLKPLAQAQAKAASKR